jgi:hypothetical protein
MWFLIVLYLMPYLDGQKNARGDGQPHPHRNKGTAQEGLNSGVNGGQGDM